MSTNGGMTWVAHESDVRNNRYTHTGLSAGDTVHYRVFAINQHGISPVSDTFDGTTADSTAPNRPTNLMANVGTSTDTTAVANSDEELTISLSWTAPVNPRERRSRNTWSSTRWTATVGTS